MGTTRGSPWTDVLCRSQHQANDVDQARSGLQSDGFAKCHGGTDPTGTRAPPEPYAARRPHRSELAYTQRPTTVTTSCWLCQRGEHDGNWCNHCWNRRAALRLGAETYSGRTTVLCRPQHADNYMGGPTPTAVHTDVRRPEREWQHHPTAACVSTWTTAIRMGNATYQHSKSVLCRPQHEDYHMGRSAIALVARPKRATVQA